MLRAVLAALAALLCLAPAMAADPFAELSGTLAIRERIALPPGAEAEIVLAPLAGGPALASVRVSADRLPAPFALVYDPRLMISGARYGVSAELHAERRTLFGTPEPVEIGPGAERPALVLVAGGRARGIEDLIDRDWRAIALANGTGGVESVSPGIVVRLRIGADGQLSGTGGCNAFSGGGTLGSGTLQAGPLAATQMACEPEAMAEEQRLFAALAAVRGWSLRGDRLRLTDAAGSTLAILGPDGT